MRIAIIIEEFPTLSETFIYVKVKQLALRGHELFIFCNKKNQLLLIELFSGITNLTVLTFSKRDAVLFVLTHPGIALQSLREADKNKFVYGQYRVQLINRYNPGIIHFEFSGIGIAYNPLMPLLKGRKVVSCRGSGEKVKLLTDSTRKEKMVALFNQVNAIHCVSDDMKQTILPYCSNPEKIFINYPSIDTVFFNRQKPYIKHDRVTILSIGRFTFQKGYLTGLQAIQRLKAKGYLFNWQIVGSGPQHEELVFHIHQMQLQDVVVLLGARKRPEVMALLEEADMYFLPSVYEGIANVVLEAMSMQLPVVCTTSGGMEEVITHGKNGLLSPVYDADSLADNLAVLVKDFELRKSLGVAARQRIVEQFDIQTQVTRFETVYTQIIQEQA